MKFRHAKSASAMVLCLLVGLFFSLYPSPATAAPDRVALVMGKAAYVSGPLKNPANDARDMADILKRLGFDVIPVIDADRAQMIRAINEFGGKLRRAEVGIFYYAGHGMQIQGTNYLLPVDARPETESDVEFEAVDAARVLGKMRDPGNKFNIVILDACRDNPFARSFRSSEKGLARMDAPAGSAMAYATSPDSVAADGDGRNGIYTKHLLAQITRPDLSIQDMLMETGLNVMRETSEKKIPWVSSTPIPRYYLAAAAGTQTDRPAQGPSKALVSVSSNISGATVSINGTAIGIAPVDRREVSPGSHQVRVAKDGYDSYETKVTVEAGRHVSLDAILSLTAPASGRLYVNPDPSDALIRILNIDPAYSRGMDIAPGRYQVEASKSGYDTRTQWVDVAAGEDKYITVSMKPSVSGRFTNTLGMEFIYISPSTFMMGSPSSESGRGSDETQHRVTLTNGYYLQTTEVTQGQWKAVMGSNPSYFSSCGDDCPVEQVSWNDVQEFIRRLNQREGTSKYRLPTEAEWEYACRAGADTPFAFGRCLSTDQANYDGNHPLSGCCKGVYRETTVPVGSFSPNALGSV